MILVLSAVLSVVIIVVAFLFAPADASLRSAEPAGFLLLWTRYSAHLAFAFLIVAFSASTLKRVSNNALSTYLMRHRRQVGLGFATAHFAHLTALSLYLTGLEGFSVDASTAVAGFGYVVLLALTLTSNDWSVKQMGPVAWRRLHTTGINILMLYFFVAFSAKLLTEGDAIYTVYIMAIALAVITKLSIKRNYRAITPD
jgi:DMSO/TMAO reductase YedYZ heme-binding membrane subunit